MNQRQTILDSRISHRISGRRIFLHFPLLRIFAIVLGIGTIGVGNIGCQSLVEAVLEKPEVKFHSVTIRDANREGATAVVAIEVTNPNSMALTVDQLDYSLALGGREIAKATVNEFAKIEAQTTSHLEIPIPFQYSQVFSSLIDLMSKGTATYKVLGQARIGIFTLPFDQGGDLKIR